MYSFATRLIVTELLHKRRSCETKRKLPRIIILGEFGNEKEPYMTINGRGNDVCTETGPRRS